MAKIIIETKIEECHKWEHTHKQIQGLMKGVLYSANYCPECGESLKEKRPVTTTTCSSCGVGLLPLDLYKYQFCPKCGEKFE